MKRLTSLLLTTLLLVTIVTLHKAAAEDEESTTTTTTVVEGEGHHSEPVVALLFPCFVAVIGVALSYVQSRAVPWIPYTAAMFVIGAIMGIAVQRLDHRGDGHPNLLHESIVQYWMQINGEVLLVGFLPGLIFSDASSQNTHLFQVAFGQCFIFAFPMVLCGTILTALVAYYIFPYEWSFNLALTFGAILSATDPVAVAALLNELGAPPRLKVHIAGESLLNDGSAFVFFTIFSSLFLLELDLPGVGDDFDIPQGITKFLQMSAGGAAIGMFFGIGMLGLLLFLDRRLSQEENVTEVALTIAVSYACYFTAEIAWGASGVISVVVLGVMTTSFGRSLINDFKLLEDFWSLVEWLLNTIIFALGGLVWGSVISNVDDEVPEFEFSWRDWGYLLLLFVLLICIRLVLFTLAYPVISRIGLKSNLREMVFHVFGGLRGSVGIAMALSLNDSVMSQIDRISNDFPIQTNKVFGFIGGIAFLTLCVNGVLAGPFLKLLGLTNPSATRTRLLKSYQNHARQHAIDVFASLLSEQRFRGVNFAVIRHHVPMLKDLTLEEIVEAAKNLNQNDETKNAELQGVKRYLNCVCSSETDSGSMDDNFDVRKKSNLSRQKKENALSNKRKGTKMQSKARKQHDKEMSSMTQQELRQVFLELVRSRYEHQITDGELANDEFVAYTLRHALDLASDCVSNGDKIRDWDFVDIVRIPIRSFLNKVFSHIQEVFGFEKLLHFVFGEVSKNLPNEHMTSRISVERCIAFITAHAAAQAIFKEEFVTERDLSDAEARVVSESEDQVKKAEKALSKFPHKHVEVIVSHKICKIVLYNVVEYIENLVESGLLKRPEAEDMLSEIQKSLRDIDTCKVLEHPGELSDVASEVNEDGDAITKEKLEEMLDKDGSDKDVEASAQRD